MTIWYQRVRFVEENNRFREAVAELTTFVNLLVSLFSVGAGNFVCFLVIPGGCCKMAGGSGAELRERIARLEDLIGLPREGEAVVSMAAKIEGLHVQLQNLQTLIEERINAANEKTDGVDKDMGILAELNQSEVQRLDLEIGVLKKAVNSGTSEGMKKYRIPEPKPYAGAREAKELENFVYDLDQYFRAAHVAEEEMVAIATMYLSDDAKLWWRTRVEDKSRAEITSLDDLKKELREQFLPANSGWQARETLRKVVHDKSVREYVKRFTSVMLDIKGMSDDDKVFNFVTGLQPWAQAELRRQGVRDFQQAVAAADSLVDLRLDKSDVSSKLAKKQDMGTAVTSQNGEAEKGKGKQVAGNLQQQPKGKWNSGCFLCKGPHRARECPMREQVSALILEEHGMGGTSSDAGGVPKTGRCGGMQLLPG